MFQDGSKETILSSYLCQGSAARASHTNQRPVQHEQLQHCDQTYRNQFRNEFYQAHSKAAGNLPCPWSFPQVRNDVDTQGKKHPESSGSKPTATLAVKQQAITIETSNFTKQNWFHSLPFQRFQALLTLFPKSFSSFPHGACLLSVSNLYLALDEIYHLWRSKPDERDS